jgi:predicted transcriptional regulator
MAQNGTEQSTRRAMGELEHQLLQAIWRSRNGLTPGEALEALGSNVAYTTVLTVLTRLLQKGLLVRSREGKAHRYVAAIGEAEWIAGKMRTALNSASDHRLAMSQFVGSLNPAEKTALRSVLKERSGTK